MLKIVILASSLVSAMTFATTFSNARVTDIRGYESFGQADDVKFRISLDGSAFVGDHPTADPVVQCKLFTLSESIMDIAVAAKLHGKAVSGTYEAYGTNEANCKVVHMVIDDEAPTVTP